MRLGDVCPCTRLSVTLPVFAGSALPSTSSPASPNSPLKERAASSSSLVNEAAVLPVLAGLLRLPRATGACRAFATTISDYRGVRRYSGEACRPANGGWRLTGIVPDDTTLL